MTQQDYIGDLEAIIDYEGDMEAGMYERICKLLQIKINSFNNSLDYDNPENTGGVQDD